MVDHEQSSSSQTCISGPSLTGHVGSVDAVSRGWRTLPILLFLSAALGTFHDFFLTADESRIVEETYFLFCHFLGIFLQSLGSTFLFSQQVFVS